MWEPEELGTAAWLLGADAGRAAARLKLFAAGERASRTICRLDGSVGQLARPKAWLRLEELAGVAAAARAAGEGVERIDLLRDRLQLRTLSDTTLGETARELGVRWSDDNGEQMSRREAVVAELLQPGAAGEPPASLIALGLRLEAIARAANWLTLQAPQVTIDPAARRVAIAAPSEPSTIGDYLLAQPSAFERIGISTRRLPGIVASPALLTSTEGEALDRLTRWLDALTAAAEAAQLRLDRYRRFERRAAAVIAACDKRRGAAIERMLALFSDHWMLWPRRAATLAGMPHNSIWRAMNEGEHSGLICRLPGTYPGGAGVYALTPVAEAAGLRVMTDEAPPVTAAQGRLRLEAIDELDAAEANIDRLIGSAPDEPTFFSLDDVEL